VKFDRKFVRSLPGSEQNLKLIQSVQQISQHFGFQLIAEGIQNAEQCKSLVSIGCELGQGTFLAETMGKASNDSQKKMIESGAETKDNEQSNIVPLTA
jgi:EAL domain-containing protein (putative c-di-GMP-specific phosphodiesterase class I)